MCDPSLGALQCRIGGSWATVPAAPASGMVSICASCADTTLLNRCSLLNLWHAYPPQVTKRFVFLRCGCAGMGAGRGSRRVAEQGWQPCRGSSMAAAGPAAAAGAAAVQALAGGLGRLVAAAAAAADRCSTSEYQLKSSWRTACVSARQPAVAAARARFV